MRRGSAVAAITFLRNAQFYSALVILVLSFISMLSVVPVLLLLLASHKIASDCRLLASESC